VRGSAWGVKPEFECERVSRENVYASLVLRDDIFAIGTEAKVIDVWAEWIRESLLEQDIVKTLFVPNPVVMEDGVLPLAELIGGSARPGIDARGGKRVNVL
jgi:hypothetical protein